MRTKSFIRLAALLGSFLVYACPIRAVEWKSEEFNCSIEFPEGWDRTDPPGPLAKAAARNRDQSRVVVVMVLDHLGAGVSSVNDSYIAGIKGGFTRGGGVIDSDRRSEWNGLPAYELVGHTAGQGRIVSLKMKSIIADGKAYTLQIVDTKGDVANDSEMARCLDSFHFLQPPKPIPASLLRTQSAAYRAGYWVGYFGMFVGFIVVVVFVIMKAFSSRRAGRNIKPPPLPPTKPG